MKPTSVRSPSRAFMFYLLLASFGCLSCFSCLSQAPRGQDARDRDKAGAIYALQGRVVVDGAPVAGAVICDMWRVKAASGVWGAFYDGGDWGESLEELYRGGVPTVCAVTAADGRFVLRSDAMLTPFNAWTGEDLPAEPRTLENDDYMVLYQAGTVRTKVPSAAEPMRATHGVAFDLRDDLIAQAGTTAELRADLALAPLRDASVAYETFRESLGMEASFTAPGSQIGVLVAALASPETLLEAGHHDVAKVRLPVALGAEQAYTVWLSTSDAYGLNGMTAIGAVSPGEATDTLVTMNLWDDWMLRRADAGRVAFVALRQLLTQQASAVAAGGGPSLPAVPTRPWVLVSVTWPGCAPCYDPYDGIGFWERASRTRDHLAVLALHHDVYGRPTANGGVSYAGGLTESAFLSELASASAGWARGMREILANAAVADGQSGYLAGMSARFAARFLPPGWTALGDQQYPLYLLFARQPDGSYVFVDYNFAVPFEKKAEANARLLAIIDG